MSFPVVFVPPAYSGSLPSPHGNPELGNPALINLRQWLVGRNRIGQKGYAELSDMRLVQFFAFLPLVRCV